MTQEKIEFTLVSPEKHVMSELVDMIVVPGEAGDFGVLPDHAAMISNLRPGLLTIFKGEEKKHIFITEGFANVNEKGCVVISETSEPVEDLNLEEMENLYQKLQEEIDIARNESEKHALNRNRELMMRKIQLLKNLSGH